MLLLLRWLLLRLLLLPLLGSVMKRQLLLLHGWKQLRQRWNC
jgi:hypothetical protein